MIENVLIEKLNDSNVCLLANAAVKANADNLQDHCVCFIVEAAKEFKPLAFVDKLCHEIKADFGERMLVSSSNIAY